MPLGEKIFPIVLGAWRRSSKFIFIMNCMAWAQCTWWCNKIHVIVAGCHGRRQLPQNIDPALKSLINFEIWIGRGWSYAGIFFSLAATGLHCSQVRSCCSGQSHTNWLFFIKKMIFSLNRILFHLPDPCYPYPLSRWAILTTACSVFNSLHMHAAAQLLLDR